MRHSASTGTVTRDRLNIRFDLRNAPGLWILGCETSDQSSGGEKSLFHFSVEHDRWRCLLSPRPTKSGFASRPERAVPEHSGCSVPFMAAIKLSQRLVSKKGMISVARMAAVRPIAAASRQNRAFFQRDRQSCSGLIPNCAATAAVSGRKSVAGEPMNSATTIVFGSAFTSSGAPIWSVSPALISNMRSTPPQTNCRRKCFLARKRAGASQTVPVSRESDVGRNRKNHPDSQ